MDTRLSRAERKVLIVGGLAIVAAIVTYGLLKSTGTFKNEIWDLSGAIVGFLAALYSLNKVYGQSEQELSPELETFCRSVEGCWWSSGADPGSIGFAILKPAFRTGTLSLKGRSFREDGEVVAVWESVASCIYLEQNKLYYYWQGHWPKRPKEPYEGFGEISFYDTEHRSDSGAGIYFDTNLVDIQSTTKKTSNFMRCTDEEVVIMHGGNKAEIAALIKRKLTFEADVK